jgi:transcriptional regulator with XRE-family HTH domain
MFRLKSLFHYGTLVFDKENESTDTPDVTGDNTNVTAGKAGGGGAADKKDDDDASKKPETHTVNVDGEDRQFTLEELKTHTSKVAAADKRFRESAETAKTGQRGIRIETLVKSISGEGTPSEADVRELAGLLGVEPTEFMQYLNDETPPQKDSKDKTTVSDFNEEFKKQMGASPAEVRAILEHSQNRHIEDARKEIREISDKAVDKDAIIGKMIVGEDKDETSLAVKDMVAEDVLRKIQDGKPFGAELVAASVQRVRAQLTKLGIPKKLNQQPIVLGLTPSEGLPSAIQADEPIKRIPSTEDGAEKNLIARYMQKAVKAAREMR